jgi:hypothetical protein
MHTKTCGTLNSVALFICFFHKKVRALFVHKFLKIIIMDDLKFQ